MSTITVRKRNHRGEPVWEYTGEVIERGATWVCLAALFNGKEGEIHFLTFRRGDLFTEWFYTDRWYNVFEVHDGESPRVKGWYCNVTRPAMIAEDTVAADDLALDLIISPTGQMMLLDEDEFEALNLSPEDRASALAAVAALREAVSARLPPFDRIERKRGARTEC